MLQSRVVTLELLVRLRANPLALRCYALAGLYTPITPAKHAPNRTYIGLASLCSIRYARRALVQTLCLRLNYSKKYCGFRSWPILLFPLLPFPHFVPLFLAVVVPFAGVPYLLSLGFDPGSVLVPQVRPFCAAALVVVPGPCFSPALLLPLECGVVSLLAAGGGPLYSSLGAVPDVLAPLSLPRLWCLHPSPFFGALSLFCGFIVRARAALAFALRWFLVYTGLCVCA